VASLSAKNDGYMVARGRRAGSSILCMRLGAGNWEHLFDRIRVQVFHQLGLPHDEIRDGGIIRGKGNRSTYGSESWNR
jgi:hypothetical protein